MKGIAYLALACLALLGCQKVEKAEEQPAKARIASQAAEVKKVSWDEAIKSIGPEKDKKIKDDGTYTYIQYIARPDSKEKVALFVTRDEFKKVRFYHTYLGYSNIISRGASLNMYISLRDGYKPRVVLSPIFKGSEWLFMNKLQIMADGNLIVDREIPYDDVERRQVDSGVKEEAHVFLTGPEVSSLRQATISKNISVRLSGREGYLNMKKRDIEFLSSGVRDTLIGYDLIWSALPMAKEVDSDI